MRKFKLSARRGFSLIELVMVIFILAILAGTVSLMVGRLPSATSTSISAGTIDQAFRALQQFRSTQGRFPTRFDLLLSDHTSSQLPASLAPVGTDIFSAAFALEMTVIDTTSTSGNTIARLLASNGITSVVETPDNLSENQTVFDMTTGSAQIIDVVDNAGTPTVGHLVTLGTAAITRLGLDTSGDSTYVVLGLGNNCDIVGTTMLHAPFHSRQEAGAVVERYARFMPVFRYDGSDLSLATIVTLENVDGVATVTGISDYLRAFYESRNQSN